MILVGGFLVFTLSWISPDGNEWDFNARESPAFLVAGGLDGFVGSGDPVTSRLLGYAGESFSGIDVSPFSGTLSVMVRAFALQRFRSDFSMTEAGTLVVDNSSGQRFFARCRLASPLTIPSSGLRNRDAWMSVSVELKCFDGVWFTESLTGVGTVTVTNYGDVTTYVNARINGNSGAITMPSGASQAFPATSSERIMSLSPLDSCMFYTPDGKKDLTLWRAQGGRIFPEGVLPGESAVFVAPAGVVLEWKIGVFDPFKGV